MRFHRSEAVPRARSLFVVLSVCSGLALLTALAGCSTAPPPPAAPPPEVLVATVLQMDVPLSAEWIGTTEGFVNAEIRPRVSGYVLRQVYEEGAFVKKGAPLFEIDPRIWQTSLNQANGRLASMKVSLAKAQQDVARFQPLVSQRAVSQQELDAALSAVESAKASVESAQAAVDEADLNLQWTRVTSPIDGMAGVAAQQVGALVSEQTVMTTVSTLEPIKVSFHITEQEYLQARGVKPENSDIRLDAYELILGDGSLHPYKGEIVLTDREVDPRTGTILVKVMFPNPGNLLRPGLYAKVRTVVSLARGALLVPQRAVSELQGSYQVAVVGPGNKAAIRVVKPGPRVGSLWIIGEGLAPGDRIIVDGAQRVRSGQVVTPKPAPPITNAALTAARTEK
jgi:membrane fusion protein (multidrug efflux system)